MLAADGAGSEVRRALAASGALEAREELLDHGYKELTLAARDGEFALDAERAAHLAARRIHVDRAAEPDRTFTATLFLPHRGEPSFASVGPAQAQRVLRARIRDAVPLIPALERDYADHPVGLSARCTAGPGALRTAFCSSATRRTRSCRSMARG